MNDSVSLITDGGAVSGIAKRFAEKTSELGEHWLKDRFGSHTSEIQKIAKENAAHFVHDLAVRIKILEDRNEIQQKNMTNTEKNPQFSVFLQNTILNASQTNDRSKHELLANLVAYRLSSDNESTFALASHLASSAISLSNRRQLNLMALSSFIENASPPHLSLKLKDFRQWLEKTLQPLVAFEFKIDDAIHLVALACASFDPMSERELDILLQMKGGVDFIGIHLADLKFCQYLEEMWYEGLAGVNLTSVGLIVGSLCINQITGKDFGVPFLA